MATNENILFSDNPYTLGKGFLLTRKNTDPVNEWLDFGHILELSVNVTTEKLDHFNTRKGVKTRDRSVITQLTASGTCTVDLPIIENIKFFFMGDTITSVVQGSGTWTAIEFTLVPNKYIWLEKYQIDPEVTFVVEPAGGGTPFVEDTDYVIDRENGLIGLIEGGGITTPFAVDITGAYLADTRRKVAAGTLTSQKRHVWFIGQTGEGVKQDIKGYASMAPSGDLSLIGDDWQQFQLSVDFEKHSLYSGLFEYYDKGKASAA